MADRERREEAAWTGKLEEEEEKHPGRAADGEFVDESR